MSYDTNKGPEDESDRPQKPAMSKYLGTIESHRVVFENINRDFVWYSFESRCARAKIAKSYG